MVASVQDLPVILPNQWFRFPGNVYQVVNALNSDITILADEVPGVNGAELNVARVYVMADTVVDASVNIMKLSVQAVNGIDEPVKLISPMGFAVGAATDRVFAWGVSMEVPMAAA